MSWQQVRRHVPALGLVLLATLAVRLAWAAAVHPDPLDGRFDDTVWYRLSAHYLARGEGYLNPYTGTATANWPPGYPAFLAGVFKLFGEGASQTYVANAAVATATVAVVYAIGATLFDRRTALLGAGALALWPGQVYFTSLTLSEVLFTFLFAIATLLMLLVPRLGRGWRGTAILAFGAAAALAALTRGQALLLLPLGVVTWGIFGFRWRPAISWGILAAIVACVVIAPWTIRNQREIGSPVIIATNIGPNIWIGNHPGASGRVTTAEPIPVPERGSLTQPEYEREASELALRRGVSYIVHHPGDDVRLARTKIRAMYESDATALDWNAAFGDDPIFSNDADRLLRGLANGYWFAALALAGVGLVTSRSLMRGEASLLPITVVVWTLAHLAFFGDARFHYPIVFAFALLGARGAIVLYEALARPQPDVSRRYARA